MIKLRYELDCQPQYMTMNSAGADLKAREAKVLPPNKVVAVPTGVWITDYEPLVTDNNNHEVKTAHELFEIQIRARSGLAFKHGIMLANGVGTIDMDYRDEICVLLLNTQDQEYKIEKGERIGQMLITKVYQHPELPVGGQRLGGFGSTGKTTIDNSSSKI